MNSQRKHQPFTREEFERALSSISAFRQFPTEWYANELDEDGRAIEEYCYIIPVRLRPSVLLKIYSSCRRQNGLSRGVGRDAVRIVLANAKGELLRTTTTKSCSSSRTSNTVSTSRQKSTPKPTTTISSRFLVSFQSAVGQAASLSVLIHTKNVCF